MLIILIMFQEQMQFKHQQTEEMFGVTLQVLLMLTCINMMELKHLDTMFVQMTLQIMKIVQA